MSMDSFGIEKIIIYLPSKCLTSGELAETFGFDIDFIENKIGVRQLFLVEEERVSDLAVVVMNKLLEIYPALKRELDVLVVCTQTPDYQLPQVSSMVQGRSQLKRDLLAFDIGLGCSGFVYGISVVESLLARHGLKRGVLITAETYSRIIDPTDRNTKCLFSDGAAATLITSDGKIKFGKFSFGTDGYRYDHLIVRSEEDMRGAPRLFMDGRGIFGFAVSTIPEDVKRVCKANDIDLEDIDFFVFHQASKFVLDAIARKMETTDEGRVINVLHMFGNTVSSSIPMALKKTLSLHGKRDLNVLISGFGVGLSWATTILTTRGDCSDV